MILLAGRSTLALTGMKGKDGTLCLQGDEALYKSKEEEAGPGVGSRRNAGFTGGIEGSEGGRRKRWYRVRQGQAGWN